MSTCEKELIATEADHWRFRLIGTILAACTCAMMFAGPEPRLAAAEQTREQCRNCCGQKGFDDYYLEQCRLKCFRQPDHCADAGKTPQSKAQPPAGERVRNEPVQEDEPRVDSGPSQPAPRPPVPRDRIRQEPPVPREQVRPEPAPRERAPARVPFQWPSPLNLTPGKEWEAAAQILILNGMNNNHPNFERAMRSMEAVLVDFARSNPSGGQLPTTALERILQQNR